MTLPELAQDVLDLLRGQSVYFACKDRSSQEAQNYLQQSKAREKRLQVACRAILNPPRPDLFTEGT